MKNPSQCFKPNVLGKEEKGEGNLLKSLNGEREGQPKWSAKASNNVT